MNAYPLVYFYPLNLAMNITNPEKFHLVVLNSTCDLFSSYNIDSCYT